MIMMFFRIIILSLLLILGRFPGAETDISFEEIMESNDSDENTVMRKLLMHMSLEMREMSMELNQLRESCVNKEDVQSIVENITQSTPVKTKNAHRDGSSFINNQYRMVNVPTSTEAPVLPVVNMSSWDQMMKLFVRRSCYDWLQLGFTSPGMYSIDPDGQGIGDPPFLVYCDMITGFTFVRHDKEGQRDTSSCVGASCHNTTVSYSASMKQIRALIEASQSCQQFMKLDCYESPLHTDDGPLAWWTGGDGLEHYDWAGEQFPAHTCTCGYTSACVNPMKTCNCDANISNVWVSDVGYITNASALPVKKMVFGTKDHNKILQVKYTLGPLRCHGSKTITYPDSCMDLLVQGFQQTGWYLLGKPDSLRFSFCNIEALHKLDSVLNNPVDSIASIDVDLGNLVLSNLKFKGFILPITDHVAQLQKSYTSLEDKFASLNSEMDHLNQSMISFQRLSNLDTRQRDKQIGILEDKVENNQNRTHQHSMSLELLRYNLSQIVVPNAAAPKVKVAFHAWKRQGSQSSSETMKYETVDFNFGGGYNEDTGIFTAPTAGLYHFEAYGRRNNGNDMYFHMRKNKVNIGLARIRDSSSDQSTGIAVMSDLEVGDEIYVQLSNGQIRGASDGGTSFMGYLIYET